MEKHIDELIEIVANGGMLKTGIDVRDKNDMLLLDRDTLVTNSGTLVRLKERGVMSLPIDHGKGGVWAGDGESMLPSAPPPEKAPVGGLFDRVKRIHELRREVVDIQNEARENVRKVLDLVRESGGEFDMEPVAESVGKVIRFLQKDRSAFTYLAKEIFSHDDYLYNHSVNVCMLGTSVLSQLSAEFSRFVNSHLNTMYAQNPFVREGTITDSFVFFNEREIRNIAIGYFLHDIGKMFIPEKILNKPGKLSEEEFEYVKKHSFVYGEMVLKKNNMDCPFFHSVVVHHHSSLFPQEGATYPETDRYQDIPVYVKVCRLVDIYDAMTSKRSYREAINPVAAVTDIFRRFASKDLMLQFILHSFVQAVGIYPPGSVVTLQNRNLAYVVDSHGPIVIPIATEDGTILGEEQSPVDLSTVSEEHPELGVDRRKPPLPPVQAYSYIPEYLRETGM